MVTVVHLEVVLDSVIMDGFIRNFLAHVNTVYEYL
jgi:enamine deaminase RidA (YjgF/YER057c/UK114 family)